MALFAELDYGMSRGTAPAGTLPASCLLRHIIVIGHCMVGHRFVEALRACNTEGLWRITVFDEEADGACDRVGLTSYTESWDRKQLALPGNEYAGDEPVRLVADQRVTEIDRETKLVVTADGRRHTYDALVMATGSYAFVPPVPGHDLPACHVYRTLDDLDANRADALRTAETSPATWGWLSAVACRGWKPPRRRASSGYRPTSSR
jgi:nitrite reductase (NADH) large subunit